MKFLLGADEKKIRSSLAIPVELPSIFKWTSYFVLHDQQLMVQRFSWSKLRLHVCRIGMSSVVKENRGNRTYTR